MNNRRKLVIALGLGALPAPLTAFEQQQRKTWRVGFLHQSGRPASLDTHFIGAFARGMRELGYVEGENLVIEWRFGEERAELFPVLAAELARLKVDAIVAGGTQITRATQQATATIPIVMVSVADPVGSGFVKSLARPGGNITGQSNLVGDMGSKYLEMLLAFSPKLPRVAVLLHPDNLAHATILKGVEAVAQKHSLKVLPLAARTAAEIENAFSTMAQERVQAFIVANDAFFSTYREKIASLAMANRLLSIAARLRYAEAGILMSYGSNNAEEYRRAAMHVDKILKGAKPGDIPVEQPTTFELVINMKTAKVLGIKIPNSILVQATKVIE